MRTLPISSAELSHFRKAVRLHDERILTSCASPVNMLEILLRCDDETLGTQWTHAYTTRANVGGRDVSLQK
jgi:hypothetical protein